jgi:hypothetical protein
MERSGTVNGCNAERPGTLRNVRTGTHKCFGTNSGKLSRFKSEKNTENYFKYLIFQGF